MIVEKVIQQLARSAREKEREEGKREERDEKLDDAMSKELRIKQTPFIAVTRSISLAQFTQQRYTLAASLLTEQKTHTYSYTTCGCAYATSQKHEQMAPRERTENQFCTLREPGGAQNRWCVKMKLAKRNMLAFFASALVVMLAT